MYCISNGRLRACRSSRNECGQCGSLLRRRLHGLRNKTVSQNSPACFGLIGLLETMLVRMSLSLSSSLSLSQSVWLSVSVCLFIYLSVSVCLSLCLPLFLPLMTKHFGTFLIVTWTCISMWKVTVWRCQQLKLRQSLLGWLFCAHNDRELEPFYWPKLSKAALNIASPPCRNPNWRICLRSLRFFISEQRAWRIHILGHLPGRIYRFILVHQPTASADAPTGT